MTGKHVKSRPYLWPWNGDLRPDNTVLIVIDMQTVSAASAVTSTRWATTCR